MSSSAVGARVAAAALVYAMALAAAVGLACAAPEMSCYLNPGEDVASSAAKAALALFALGLVLMGGVLTPAAMVLRKIGWLYWWTIPPIAAATAALPLVALCILPGDTCRPPGRYGPLVDTLIFAGLSGGLFLWWSWLRHQASQVTVAQRIAVQSPAVKLGLIFLGSYVAVLAATAVFVAASSGDMTGMLFFYIALPWPLVGFGLFGSSGTDAGMLLGLALNGAIAFGVGYCAAKMGHQSAG